MNQYRVHMQCLITGKRRSAVVMGDNLAQAEDSAWQMFGDDQMHIYLIERI